MGVQSHYKAGAVGCLEWDCFDGQSYCPIPLPVGMQKGDQAGLQRMSILCSHKSVGSPWEQAGEGDAGARGMLEEAACSSHSACSALLAIEIKGATSSPNEIISLLSLPSPPPMALAVCHCSGELHHNPVMVQQCQMVPFVVSVDFSDHLPPSQPLLRAKTLLMAIASSFCRWWCSSPMTSCPKQ